MWCRSCAGRCELRVAYEINKASQHRCRPAVLPVGRRSDPVLNIDTLAALVSQTWPRNLCLPLSAASFYCSSRIVASKCPRNLLEADCGASVRALSAAALDFAANVEPVSDCSMEPRRLRSEERRVG